MGYWGLLSTCVFANTHVGSLQEAMMGGCLGFSKESQCTVCASMYVSTKAVLYFFTLGGPCIRDRELLCDRAHARPLFEVDPRISLIY